MSESACDDVHADGARLRAGRHTQPHRYLGIHPIGSPQAAGVVVRAFHPDAQGCVLRTEAGDAAMHCDRGVFEILLPQQVLPLAYTLRFVFADATTWETEDPYRFLPSVGQLDEHLLGEGRHARLWDVFGAHRRTCDGVAGTAFAVWAPNAARVSVVGDFCQWDGRRYPMRALGSSGIFELFLPKVADGDLYKYEVLGRNGRLVLKADPFAQAAQIPPQTASRVFTSCYTWADARHMQTRAQRDVRRSPLNIYEVHLGSWARVSQEGNRPLSYREIAPRLAEYACQLGFNALQLLPIAEHPFAGSWGYQVSGYYAPTARFGTPDDFRAFVDICHAHALAVIVDWVPAHFPKDDFALAQFDGTALFEHDDPRRGEHPDWGTLIFNYGRTEVRNFLIANALYWLEEFHIDGLRVDAVASMLYLDYSRPQGQWLPNAQGGRENFEAVHFLQQLNETVRAKHPDVMMIAEESTAWSGVTRDARAGGLGFTFKWNMGWMHDTLKYFAEDPVHRKYHHGQLSFAMIYENSERFVMPLSHDEVVHGKGALLNKMPGDTWQKFANLRLLYAYQYTRPGKKLLFMGSEFAAAAEWDHDQSLDWTLCQDPLRQKLRRFIGELGQLYVQTPPLWRKDPDPDGFFWIDHHDCDQSVLIYARHDGHNHRVIALNFTPVARPLYRFGVPQGGVYRTHLCSDDTSFGGCGVSPEVQHISHDVPCHGQPHSLVLTLPPLGAVILGPQNE